jgi:predicted RNA-binding Zn ribbon-like protein
METGPDWRDGFLFVGNQLSLDFLNTRPALDGTPVELLTDGSALRRWLVAAGLKRGLVGDLSSLKTFREDYRKAILDIEAGNAPPRAFLKRLNDLLAEHPCAERIVGSGTELERERIETNAFQPILHSAVDLLTSADQTRIRKCPACVLHFYDSSKKGTRRWCSMRICGNRYKVAAYTQRRRVELRAEVRGSMSHP